MSNRKSIGGKETVRALWRDRRSPLEQLVEGALLTLSEELPAHADPSHARSPAKVVVLGGGTGLSAVLGRVQEQGRPPDGLFYEFAHVDVAICPTDDGGSSGELVRRLPLLGIGDFRKVILSMASPEALEIRYNENGYDLYQLIHKLFNYRFYGTPTREALRDPVSILDIPFRKICPFNLREELIELMNGVVGGELEQRFHAPNHAMGNLILATAILKETSDLSKPPPPEAVVHGLTRIQDMLGMKRGHIHAGTTTPGILSFEYANEVIAFGQSRALRANRRCAVHRVCVNFIEKPRRNKELLAAIKKADLIVYAPGSLYSSILPVLLSPGVADAIRANTRAVKILGANLWLQQGETDRSFREASRGFFVSELIEAYGKNIPGGIDGLFDTVLAASLDAVPGRIIRNYALEGKQPIHLDRGRVTALGVMPVEASLFVSEKWKRDTMLHHDPARFAIAVRTTYEGIQAVRKTTGKRRVAKPTVRIPAIQPCTTALVQPPCERMQAIQTVLRTQKNIPEAWLPILEDFFWQCREVRTDHLHYFDTVTILPAAQWTRDNTWTNVLGYYDPDARTIFLHKQLEGDVEAIHANFAIALGESLLGNYIESRQMKDTPLGRIYKIKLRDASVRRLFFDDKTLRQFLKLAYMTPVPGRPLEYRRLFNVTASFLPSGLLFGTLFAWYLDNRFASPLDYEMELLQWPARRLLPYQNRRRKRLREEVLFMRHKVFGVDL